MLMCSCAGFMHEWRINIIIIIIIIHTMYEVGGVKWKCFSWLWWVLTSPTRSCECCRLPVCPLILRRNKDLLNRPITPVIIKGDGVLSRIIVVNSDRSPV